MGTFVIEVGHFPKNSEKVEYLKSSCPEFRSYNLVWFAQIINAPIDYINISMAHRKDGDMGMSKEHAIAKLVAGIKNCIKDNKHEK